MVKELERRQKIKKAVYSWPALVLLALVAFFMVKGAAGLIAIERENARKVKVLERQNEALALREEALQAEIERLATDEGKIEAIKEKFSAVREGEHVAIIVDERQQASSTDSAEPSWWRRMWDAIIQEK